MQETKAKQTKTSNKGITLVALVITIIVLLILAAVGIGAIAGPEGLIAKAKQAAEGYNDAAQEEAQTINEILNMIEGEKEEKELISTTESYVGYYISTDNDNEPDGIIYGDRLHPVSGTWGESYEEYGTYTIDEIEQAKEYYICANDYEGAFGTEDVIKAVNEEEEEGKRFYVMALEDVVDEENNDLFCWYDDAYGKMDTIITSLEVGTGAENTRKMIENWNGPNGYGEPNTGSYPDVWGIAEVQRKAEEGWYVPSRAEWATFADAFNITSSNYNDEFELSTIYWSSSQRTTSRVWFVSFNYGCMYDYYDYDYHYVRLGGTF